MNKIGGPWTEDKLERVHKYLEAFQVALKNKFRTVYIDAFCGSGTVETKGRDGLPLLLEEARPFTVGSAKRALALGRPFDEYHFIEKSKKKLQALEAHVTQGHEELLSRVRFYAEDVNVALPKLIAKLDRRRDRAVLFLDPCGMQVDWTTMEAIADGVVDMWYLAPTMAINRMISGDRQMLHGWEEKLDRFLGTTAWRTEWYAAKSDGDLFGNIDKRHERIVSIQRIDEDFYRRLGTKFTMAKKRLHLSDKGNILFTLMFGCTSKSDKAIDVSHRIANHLMKEK
jgi:three-Cys-motif partner protein